ncbi:MAG: ComEC/Rec2 family competence protein [Tannerella sp.]|jgi:competence protein ComEC|nr:ComEC/Rec2 family competence protein [Tannerella sp.]
MSYGRNSITNEIRKRPFIRPLIFWLAGTLLQICFPLQAISMILPAVAVIFTGISFFISKRALPGSFTYNTRWVWGVVFAFLLIFLSIQRTSLAEQQLGHKAAPGFLLIKAGEMQEAMVNKLDRLDLSDEKKAVLATMTVNYRKNMTRDMSRRFSVVGLSHLLAVSGFHVGIISAFIGLILSFMPKRIAFFHYLKYLLLMLFIWMFTYTTGLATAAVRAAVMISIYLTGRMLKRRPDKYNTLAGAAFCMLVYNPLYLFDIGFQLSYLAVFFILYLQPRLSRLAEIRNPLLATPWNTLTVTVSAQVGTLFLCFYYFKQSSLLFLFTNLFLSLLATILIPATLMWMLIPSRTPGLECLGSAVEIMTNGLMRVVERFSSIPGAILSVRFDLFTVTGSYTALGLGLLYMQTRRYRMLLAAFAVLFLILCRTLATSFLAQV